MHSYCFDFVLYVTAESHSIAVIGFSAAITSVIIVTLVSVMCVICLVLKVHQGKMMPGNLYYILNVHVKCMLISKFSLLQVTLTPFIGNKM